MANLKQQNPYLWSQKCRAFRYDNIPQQPVIIRVSAWKDPGFSNHTFARDANGNLIPEDDWIPGPLDPTPEELNGSQGSAALWIGFWHQELIENQDDNPNRTAKSVNSLLRDGGFHRLSQNTRHWIVTKAVLRPDKKKTVLLRPFQPYWRNLPGYQSQAGGSCSPSILSQR